MKKKHIKRPDVEEHMTYCGTKLTPHPDGRHYVDSNGNLIRMAVRFTTCYGCFMNLPDDYKELVIETVKQYNAARLLQTGEYRLRAAHSHV